MTYRRLSGGSTEPRPAGVAGPIALVGGLLWAMYGVVEMLQPWGQDTVYRDELGYEVVTDVLLHWAYSAPGGLALLLTALGLLGVFWLPGAPTGRMDRVGRILASTALTLAVVSMVGVVNSFDPLFTAPRIFGTLALGAATCLAGGAVWRTSGAAGWGIALMALGLLGLFLLPLWPLVHAVEIVPEGGGAGFIALYGMGWMLTGARLRSGPIATRCVKEISPTIDHGHFDALTRSLVAGPASRRSVLRLLTCGLLVAVIARLGLTAKADAKPRRKTRTRSDRRRPGAVQSEGKKGKGKGKKGKDKDRPKPRDCGPGKKPCPDGGCVVEALCCPGQRMCAGGRCQRGCCDDEWECGDGSCVASGECCDGERPCGGGVCVSANACCPNEKHCEGEAGCFPVDECCATDPVPLCGACQEAVCDGGAWACRDREDCDPPPPPSCEDEGPCRPGYVRAPNSCACLCPDGSMGCGGWCCPSELSCLGGEGFRTWCVSDSGATQCPIGWSPYGDSGLCYPGTPPS